MQHITRLTPADLQEVQQQTSASAAISDVITALQANKSTEQKPLNTLCPTCSTNGTQRGYLPFIWKKRANNVLCPTCKGYALINTTGGQMTPPVNPFEKTLRVTRLLPSDLIEAMAAFTDSTALDALITSLQENMHDDSLPAAYDCPICAVDGVSTGWVTQEGNKTLCFICNGYQKTMFQIPAVPLSISQSVSLPTITWPRNS
jgi:hypothetical protein